MRLAIHIAVVALVLGVAAKVQAQAPSNQTPSVSAPIVSGTAAFNSELERTNYLDAGIALTSTYDDNILNLPTNPQSDIGYGILPNIDLRQSRGRLAWKLNYSAGFTAYQRFSSYNQASHDFGFESVYKLAEHTQLQVSDQFLMTNGFFDQINQNPGAPSGSILEQPNQSVIIPLAKQNSNNATVSINDQFSASSAIGASGNFFYSHYKDVPVGTSLVDTNSVEAEGYYNRRVSARNSIGVTYRFQRFTFSPIANDTNAHSVFANYTVNLKQNLTLSLFGGPQYTDTSTELVIPTLILPRIEVLAIPISQNNWSAAGGASFVWNGRHNGITAEFLRSVSNGGGLIGAANLTTATGAFRRQISKQTTASFAVNYGNTDALGSALTQYSSLRSATGSVSVTRQIRDNFGLTLGYARAYQVQGSTGTTIPDINHNRAWASISYRLSRPLGR